jgi:hypothetical protein
VNWLYAAIAALLLAGTPVWFGAGPTDTTTNLATDGDLDDAQRDARAALQETRALRIFNSKENL